MKGEMVILIAEDDMGHAALIQKNLKRAGITNQIIHFKDGEETLNFLFQRTQEPQFMNGTSYLLLLDIRMPKFDGVEVLRQVKGDPKLKRMPVIMITTTDDPREVEHCHSMGCSNYITKPIDYDNFVDAIRKLGLFLMVVEVPGINGETEHN